MEEYEILRSQHTEGEDAAANNAMDEIYAELYDLDYALKKDKPETRWQVVEEEEAEITYKGNTDTAKDTGMERKFLKIDDDTPPVPIVA